MSAYTALVSLRQMLETANYNIPQLQSLLEEVDLLLDFLEISPTCEASRISELETKIRDAADGAKHLVDHKILNRDMITSRDMFCFSTGFAMFSLLLAKLEVMPVWIPLFLAEFVICMMNAVFLYLLTREIFGFPTMKASQEWRRLFYDFKIIAEKVNSVKESQPVLSALISLSQILDSVLDSGGYNNHYLKPLQEKVSFVLENASSSLATYNTSIQSLDTEIRDAVYKAERALIEFKLPMKSGLIFDWRRFCTLYGIVLLISPVWIFMSIRPECYYANILVYCFVLLISYFHLFILTRISFVPTTLAYYYLPTSLPEMKPTLSECLGQMRIVFASCMCSVVIVLAVLLVQYIFDYEPTEHQELANVVDDFDIIVRDMIKIKDGCGEGGDLSADAASSARQDFGGSGRDVVGLESDEDEIKGRLVQDSSKLELISIVGMGGIGKTTLANRVYHDPHIVDRFDVRAWTMISQGNTLRHVLLSLIDSARMLTEEEKHQTSDVELGVHLHKYLTGRRFLIVVDDVWNTEIWDFLRIHFPENCNNSRVLLTSRLPNVVSRLDPSSRLHHMQCLNEDHSWELLFTEVFRTESCPLELELELEHIGRKIVRRCGGLPLAIVVIGGLLYKEIHVDVWRDVAEKLEKSEVQNIKERCLNVLGLSYSHLPRNLRPCFLYTGMFLAYTKIPISRLISLWIAEGFLRPNRSKTLEEVAEGYVKDLVDRNLISISRWSCNGMMRACSMHDLLRDVCVENARKEKFRHVVISGGYLITREGPDESPRSLSIHPNAQEVKRIYGYLGSAHLRVLDVLEANFDDFPPEIIQLVSLRYLAFRYDGLTPLPRYICNLWFLETLVLHHSSFGKNSYLPSSIWLMPNLRHIYVKPGCYMFKPFEKCYSFHENLQTLVGIRNFKWTKGIVEKISNLKKLGISYDFSSSANWSTYQLENLFYLEKLESLKIIVEYDDLGSAVADVAPPKLAFPQKLKKLSLNGCRIPWECMSSIGALPNLEALKLRCEAFCGPSWATLEGKFSRLVFLLLEKMSFTTWETEESHFPRLQRLVLRSCIMLEKIPSSIGDIPTLELIEMVDCQYSAVVSAREMQEEQESMGNEVLKFSLGQRRREVDGMDFGNLGARGTGPGAFEVLKDVIGFVI